MGYLPATTPPVKFFSQILNQCPLYPGEAVIILGNDQDAMPIPAKDFGPLGINGRPLHAG